MEGLKMPGDTTPNHYPEGYDDELSPNHGRHLVSSGTAVAMGSQLREMVADEKIK